MAAFNSAWPTNISCSLELRRESSARFIILQPHFVFGPGQIGNSQKTLTCLIIGKVKVALLWFVELRFLFTVCVCVLLVFVYVPFGNMFTIRANLLNGNHNNNNNNSNSGKCCFINHEKCSDLVRFSSSAKQS